ncbi:hypothetical protein Tco_0771956 [Tanacetum coccineum]|uniref:Uncharacterized protein n=1 Tax=Tanacetum coccineum TaxID=301880 RepID=A0ABQ4ZJY3_9ASTR
MNSYSTILLRFSMSLISGAVESLPPRRFTMKSVKRDSGKSVFVPKLLKNIKNRADSNYTRWIMDCKYWRNCLQLMCKDVRIRHFYKRQHHSFSGMKALVGLKRGLTKMEQVKWEDQQGNNYHQQQNRRQEAAKVYVAAPAKGRGYAGNLPWCNRCKAHHQPGPCPPRCGKCHKLGHQEGECRTRIPVARDNSLQNVTCFGCGNNVYYEE